MITQSGSISAECNDRAAAKKMLTKKLYTVSLASFIVGIIGILIYIVAGVAYEIMYEQELPVLDVLLVISAVLFGFGLVFVITVRKQNKDAVKFNGCSLSYEFFADCIIVREFKYGEQTGVVRWNYAQVTKCRQKNNYIYIFMAYPLDISPLTAEELNTVKSLLKLPCEGEKLTLPCFSGEDGVPTGEIKTF